MSDYTITSSEINKLQSSYAVILGTMNTLQAVIHPDVQNTIRKALDEVYAVISAPLADMDMIDDARRDAFDAFSTEHNLDSVWSISEASHPDELSPFDNTAGELFISYSQFVHQSPVYLETRLPRKHLTYGDLYKAADVLIANSGRPDHIFIESFERFEGSKHINLSTGS